MIQKPNVLGLIVCERVIVEEGSRNPSFISILSKLTIRNAEDFSPPFYVCAILADGLGEMTISLQISSLDVLELCYERKARLRFSDPLKRPCLFKLIGAGALQGVGSYQIELFAEGELLAQTTLDLVLGG